ncbi:MAG: hypothetical protein PHG85_05305 [Candidatus Altiarchaeota archaeon]|nr:hypothetical protein [Candidatus Altiarchaeota archaeon]
MPKPTEAGRPANPGNAGAQAHNTYDGMLYNVLKALGPKDFLKERSARRIPDGAVRFMATLPNRREYDSSEVEDVRRKFNCSDIMVLHGAALEVNGRAVVITGPPGIGKSTALRRQYKRNNAPIIEDSFVLVGVDKTDGGLKLIETGMYLGQKRQVVSRSMRKLLHMQSPYITLHGDKADSGQFEKVRRLGMSISHWAGVMENLLTPASPKVREFHPRSMAVSDLIYCVHKKDEYPPLLLPEGEKPKSMASEEFIEKAGGARMHVFRLPDNRIRAKLQLTLDQLVWTTKGL